MLAGNETTATAILWMLYLLLLHDDAQERCRREVADVLAGGAPTYGALPRLRALEQAVKEAMRLYPPAYVLAREAADDVTIGGHAIPRGAQLVLVPYLTQRDPRWFPDPDEFRPERFDGEQDFPRGAYLPFGLGPRACIGRGLAMTEMVAALALVLQRHRLRPPPGAPAVVPRAQISLHPRDGLRLALTPAG
jgi:cytochrome P450